MGLLDRSGAPNAAGGGGGHCGGGGGGGGHGGEEDEEHAPRWYDQVVVPVALFVMGEAGDPRPTGVTLLRRCSI